jgi:hypothetical protein
MIDNKYQSFRYRPLQKRRLTSLTVGQEGVTLTVGKGLLPRTIVLINSAQKKITLPDITQCQVKLAPLNRNNKK